MMWIEKKVDFSHVVPGGFGTSDFITIDLLTGKLFVVDLKYGKGKKVYAENNTQGALYAIGALNELDLLYDIKSVVIVIIQPRLDHIDEWEVSVKELNKLAKKLNKAAEEALSDEPTFNPGVEQCQWCKAKAQCKPHAKFIIDLASDGFSEIDEPIDFCDPDKLSNKQIGFIAKQFKMIESWMEAVKKLLETKVRNGESGTGFKLVIGRSNRVWIDEKEAAKRLKQEFKLTDKILYTKKFWTITEAEKRLGKSDKVLMELLVKPPGKETVVPEEDKRPAIVVEDATEGFDIIP